MAAEVLITAPSGARVPRTTAKAPFFPNENPAARIAPEAGGAVLATSPMVAPVTVTALVSIRLPSSRNSAGTPPARSRSGSSPAPDGSTSASTGMPSPRRPRSSRGSGIPARPAIAAR